MRGKIMYSHPCHEKMIRGLLNPTNGLPPIYGIKVVFDENIPKFAKKWVFPKEQFWEYEPSDEKWCRQLGIGHEIETTEPVIWMVDEPSFDFLRAKIPIRAIT
jgi:hypothetical protein